MGAGVLEGHWTLLMTMRAVSYDLLLLPIWLYDVTNVVGGADVAVDGEVDDGGVDEGCDDAGTAVSVQVDWWGQMVAL
jgi:hypothetical protein